MPDLRQTRNRLKIAAAALIAIDVVALVLLFSPLAGSAESRHEDLRRLWLDLKSRESAPWRGLDKKIPLAQKQIDDFYHDRLPAEDSAISISLGKVVATSGVRMSSVKYKQKDVELQGLQLVEVEADLSGNYLQLVRFINELERNRLFFIVDELQLGSQQNGIVKLQIKLETYLRSA